MSNLLIGIKTHSLLTGDAMTFNYLFGLLHFGSIASLKPYKYETSNAIFRLIKVEYYCLMTSI